MFAMMHGKSLPPDGEYQISVCCSASASAFAFFHVAKELHSIDAGIRALLLSLKWLRFYERDRPPLELILIAQREIARSIQVFWRAVDFELRAAFVTILQPLFDQRDREMRDVDPDPFALQLLRRIHRRPAT